ncbi:HAD family hydrolase [Kitasatospora sp. NPDC056327]|uniref:HAD family hydrolase n=1 Tax=Kitasatospora sp. NPDC056327 TaxID=3345785 RepID=UPI0035E37B55
MLILDFDGVIADAFTECALVTWYADRDPAEVAARPLAERAAELPPEFLNRFRTVREHARVLGDFMVARHPASGAITGPADYRALAAALPAPERARLVAGASAVRARLSAERRAEWLGLHTLYPGIPALLERHRGGSTAVVTAKDEKSVWEILGHHGLADTVAQVVGDCSDKATAVRDLAAAEGLEPADVTFVDDHIANTLAVGATGATALWAWWGYHTADHVAIADRHGQRRLQLADLATLSV